MDHDLTADIQRTTEALKTEMRREPLEIRALSNAIVEAQAVFSEGEIISVANEVLRAAKAEKKILLAISKANGKLVATGVKLAAKLKDSLKHTEAVAVAERAHTVGIAFLNPPASNVVVPVAPSARIGSEQNSDSTGAATSQPPTESGPAPAPDSSMVATNAHGERSGDAAQAVVTDGRTNDSGGCSRAGDEIPSRELAPSASGKVTSRELADFIVTNAGDKENGLPSKINSREMVSFVQESEGEDVQESDETATQPLDKAALPVATPPAIETVVE